MKMENKIEILKLDNGNFEVCVGDDIIHTASSLQSAHKWVSRTSGEVVVSHNYGNLVVVPDMDN